MFVLILERMLTWSVRETNIQNLGFIGLLKIYKKTKGFSKIERSFIKKTVV